MIGSLWKYKHLQNRDFTVRINSPADSQIDTGSIRYNCTVVIDTSNKMLGDQVKLYISESLGFTYAGVDPSFNTYGKVL